MAPDPHRKVPIALRGTRPAYRLGGWAGGKSEIRNDMTTAWPRQASRNVILSEASQRDAESKDLRAGIPKSEIKKRRARPAAVLGRC